MTLHQEPTPQHLVTLLKSLQDYITHIHNQQPYPKEIVLLKLLSNGLISLVIDNLKMIEPQNIELFSNIAREILNLSSVLSKQQIQ